jgi:hypothetical protein
VVIEIQREPVSFEQIDLLDGAHLGVDLGASPALAPPFEIKVGSFDDARVCLKLEPLQFRRSAKLPPRSP